MLESLQCGTIQGKACFIKGMQSLNKQLRFTVYKGPLYYTLLPGFVGSLLDWQGALFGLFSFTAIYEITEPHCPATTVVQYFREGSEKGSGFGGRWHLITTS